MDQVKSFYVIRKSKKLIWVVDDKKSITSNM